MTTVFVAGSRNLKQFSPEIRERLENLISGSYEILVGDAHGADKAVQKFFLEKNYPNVVIYCSGNTCRNNTGDWPVHNVPVPSDARGRDFYTRKDLEMAHDADYGFMIWDAKSPGTISNVLELLKEGKSALVHVSRNSSFHRIITCEDLENLLMTCSKDDLASLSKKIHLQSRISEVSSSRQQALDL